MNQKIEIRLGLFSEPIEKQFKKQGLIDKNVKTHQKKNDLV